MHDVAVTSWGLKGYYDYVRPMSAIRYMADRGQSSDPSLPSYHPQGLPLVPGFIEIIEEGDPLAGASNENIGVIKMYAWRGPEAIVDPNNDVAGVDWIFAREWFPYQRPSFVTPPFAGYVSGHSTFSRAAAEMLTLLTGDPFFPGGIGTFDAPANSFLKFERGPSQTVQLQWATYRDASDQTSLSRIWGGIHPPIDDIPGRLLGEKIGKEAFAFAESYFTKELAKSGVLFPLPMKDELNVLLTTEKQCFMTIFDMLGRKVMSAPVIFDETNLCKLDVSRINEGVYLFTLRDELDSSILFQGKLLKE
jgi:hypothetical protein